MKSSKEKLSAEDIVKFFEQKPYFDKSQTDSANYGWPSTKNGLYSISDIFAWFAEKGYNRKDIDDVLYKYFQYQDLLYKKCDKEKGKTHDIYLIRIKNYYPHYNTSFIYYYYDITPEKALKLKKEYEEESLALMLPLIEKKKLAKNTTTKKPKNTTPKLPRKSRVKKEVLIEI